MINTVELNVAIMRRGLTKKKVAEILEISESSLQYKINNKREFKVSEIVKLQNMLGLSVAETNDIFLQGCVN
jgi:plasmid maintenance system antidote protein VapI